MNTSRPPVNVRGLYSKVARKVAGRLTNSDSGAQMDWQAWYRQATAKKSPETVLLAHQNASELRKGFSVGAYLEKNLDVTDKVATAGEAVYHFLDFGLAEGRDGKPWAWDPAFVRLFHGHDLPTSLDPVQATERLLRLGVPIDALFLTEEHLWLSFGLHGPFFAKTFQHELYAVSAAKMQRAVPGTDRLSCIRHYCEVGLAARIPMDPLQAFDDEFYTDALRVAGVEAPAKGTSLIRHWAQVGVRAGAHANAAAQVKGVTGISIPETILATLDRFRRATPGLTDESPQAEVISRLITTPHPGTAVFDRSQPGVQGFLMDLARYRRSQGDTGGTEWLLGQVLEEEYTDPMASLELADVIHPQSRLETETEHRRNVPEGFDIGANQITLAERFLDQSKVSAALKVAEGLPPTVFGDVALNQRRKDIGARSFRMLWDNLSQRMTHHGVPNLQRLLSRSLDVYTPAFEPPKRNAPIRRVAILANDDLYQCKLYRADQKADQLRAAGYSVTVYAQSRDVDLLRSRLLQYDAVIFMRVPAFLHIIDLIRAAAQHGATTFYDADDLIFDTALFPPPLETYSGTITAQDHDAMACGVPLFAHAMSLCDYGIASTPTIQAEMQKVVRTGQVFLHRNALGQPHMRLIAGHSGARDNDKLVLFYGSGTKAHKAEFHDILEPAMAAALKARPGKVEIRIVGQFSGFKHLDPEHPDVHLLEPIWDFETYCTELAKADINLSILESSIITDAKSEIKWMEAAMFGIPSIVSPTATHVDVVEDGVSGILAADKDAFTKALLALIDNPSLRQKIGAAAREQALRDYGLPAMGANFDRMFDAVRPAAKAGASKRILIVNVFYPPQDIGGATRVARDNIDDILEHYGDEFEIDVITTLEGGQTEYEVSTYARDGARVWTITARNGIDNMETQDHRMADVFDQLLDEISPDLVHFHCIQRLTASIVDVTRRRNIPYVVTLHDGWWVSPNQFVAGPSGKLETYDFTRPESRALPERARIVYRGLRDAAAVLAVSPAFAELHKQAGLDFVDVVENGLSGVQPVTRKPGKVGRVRLGHIGGAARHKGYAVLRAAVEAAPLKNIDLVIVDHGQPMGQTRQEMWNTTPVTFLPRVPLDRVSEIYEQIDVLLAPSTWPESYGLVTREALAAGLWVVASDMGAIGQDVVEGENGHVVSVTDHTALAACLQRIDDAPSRYSASPEYRVDLRRSEDQAMDLAAIYKRLLGVEDRAPVEANPVPEAMHGLEEGSVEPDADVEEGEADGDSAVEPGSEDEVRGT